MVTPTDEDEIVDKILLPNVQDYGSSGTLACYDLATDTVRTLEWQNAESPNAVTLENELPGGNPKLFVLER